MLRTMSDVGEDRHFEGFETGVLGVEEAAAAVAARLDGGDLAL